jgi:RimJ/RimL family protein N-acetyltransferase
MLASMSDDITLRPAREDDVPRLEDLTQDPEKTGEFEWAGWSDLQVWRRGWAANGLIGPEGGTLIVTRSGQWLGLVNWRSRPVNGPSAHCWEIGIILLPEARGHGYGTQAQRLLARYLFAHTTVHRIWAGTAVGNTAEQRALEKAGFTREGVTRAIGWHNGAWRDGVVYSLLRTDPAAACPP